ncbi:MAG: hypothetical protein J7623_00275 [Chitinophaga sp.]|uniref:hypothetical protein n=1 Tax=Chitinophaga sp. TaxID=1869181 RepID=UPI001B16F141|nr:hypothetical protein [Chitinophaga sp.]MBO9727049.1 hypothetical protein [Chitinophaga sp.]
MKRRGWIWMTGLLLTGYAAGAQTFALKPVKLLPPPKPAHIPPAPPPVYPVYRLSPDAYYQQHFGFFCKKEWVWQKSTGLPVKLRLGNYSYTQQLEGKH